jgi:hypothetical protein
MFWATADPDSSADKQSRMKSHFSMEATPQKELCWETAEYDKSPPATKLPRVGSLQCNPEAQARVGADKRRTSRKETFFSVPLEARKLSH